jgi:P27 family predicted phage terminase small subunit
MAIRGRRPHPTHLRLLRGNPSKDKLPENEPQPELVVKIPDAPDFLPPYACDEWYRIAEELVHLRLLTVVDINPLGAYCEAYSRWRTAVEALNEMRKRDPVFGGLVVPGANNNAVSNPLVNIASRAANEMVRYATEFGLTPSARARIAAGIPGDGVHSKFDGLLA